MSDTDVKQCPQCRMMVPSQAQVCAYCQHAFPGGARWKEQRRRNNWVTVLICVIAVAVVLALVLNGINESEREGERKADEFVECVMAGGSTEECE